MIQSFRIKLQNILPIFDELNEKEEARWSLKQRKLSDVFVAVAVVVALAPQRLISTDAFLVTRANTR